ncbi:hypothetical protein [Rheinheimera sp.]|uniref:hypothetical protein n=1 Tax=Rheinheimera TaxID=67575 RepID=UPI0023546ACE|nr:hypothetical protein [Rheinheimera sp.]
MSMKSLELITPYYLKSRFTGFFAFLLLSACQPQAPDQSELMKQARHEPAIAMQLAAERLARGEYDAALEWFRQAASLGNVAALEHALQLQQRQQGKLATAVWLQQQINAGTVDVGAVKPEQRSELGLWPDNTPVVSGLTSAAGCALSLQPVVTQQAGVNTWQQLLQLWQQDRQLAQLPVCFLPLHRVDSPTLACSEDSSTLLQCNYPVLDALVAEGSFSQLVVIAGRGKASYNNGILQLPDNADIALLRHEFMHILGFIDEYALAHATAAEVCRPGKIHPNLVLVTDVEAYVQRWNLTKTPALTAVDTCQAVNMQAYRVIAEDNVMRFYELPLPDHYFQLMQHMLHQPEELMPVQYYFAYLARQRQDWQKWQQFMQQASMLGYAEAAQALAP